MFADRFPSIYQYVRWLNRHDHGELIRHLQRLESWLVIENVAPKLVGKVPFVTLHDAIYSRVGDIPLFGMPFSRRLMISGFAWL